MGKQERRGARAEVRWGLIDRRVGEFTAESVVPLLSAALNSPFLGAVRDQLWLVWTRVLRCPPDGSRIAGLADLADLIAAGIAADPRPQRDLIDPADPRLVVRYRWGAARFRVHPGDLEHPLLFLRSAAGVAAAIDPFLVRRLGFGLGDVIELTLRVGDLYLSDLSPAWPSGDVDGVGGIHGGLAIDDLLSEAEVDAELRARALPLDDIASYCSHPGQAALALRWLSCEQRDLRMRVRPEGLSLGPVLAVVTDHGTVPVPVALLSQALLAASARLTALAAGDRSSLRTLQAFTSYRMDYLLQGLVTSAGTTGEGASATAPSGQDVSAEGPGPAWTSDYGAFVGPGFSGVTTSYLGRRNFWAAIDQARQSAPAVIGEAAALTGMESVGPAVVIYGGLPCLASAGPRDVPCLHVEEFAEMLADADGDRDVVAQFLREVSLYPGFSGLLYVDVMDVWWHWREEKMIGPLFPAGTGLAVLPYESKPDWERAAKLEPIEDVLARAGLPECSRWSAIRVDEPGQATMFMPAPGSARAVLVRADPPLVVIASLDDGASLGFRPDTMYGLADGIRITAGRHEHIAAGLRVADGRPLTCLVSVTSERQPLRDDVEAAGIAISVDPERAVVALQFGPEFFDRLADDPQTAHKIAGMAVHRAVQQVTGQAAAEGESFLAAWSTAPPIMMVQHFRNTAPASVPIDPVPHGEAARARARRSIAMAIESTDPPHGPVTDREVIAHISAVIEALLRQRLSESDPALAADVARALNAAHAAYWRHAHDLHFSLSAPWAADWQSAALKADDPAARIRPLELLLEFLILGPARGSHHPDRYELAELEEIAAALLEQRTRLNATDVGLNYLASDPDGDEDDDPAEKETHAAACVGLNFSAYAEARARDRVRIRAPTPAEAPRQTDTSLKDVEPRSGRQARTFREFEPIANFDLPAHLVAADAAMRESLGTGLDGIRAVLGTAVDWPTGDSGIAVVDVGQLAGEAKEWSRLPQAEIDAAVTLLSLDPQSLPDPVHRYWEVERLSFRLRVRPFPVVEGKLWVMPWAAEATQELFLIYLQDSRLPYLDPALSSSAVALRRYRQRQNRQFEEEAAAVPRDLGLSCRANWTIRDARVGGMAALPGEVDLIIADTTRRRLWVCEVKDPEPAFAPAVLSRHIERFTRTKGYIAKLLRKTRAISIDPRPAAAACGVHDEIDWTVIPLMVTRNVEPAAFLEAPQVAFTVLEDLPAVLQSEREPAPGHARIGGGQGAL